MVTVMVNYQQTWRLGRQRQDDWTISILSSRHSKVDPKASQPTSDLDPSLCVPLLPLLQQINKPQGLLLMPWMWIAVVEEAYVAIIATSLDTLLVSARSPDSFVPFVLLKLLKLFGLLFQKLPNQRRRLLQNQCWIFPQVSSESHA